jgi:hypothetical protein
MKTNIKVRHLLFILSCLLLPQVAQAQAVVEFPKKVHDFGAVSEKTDSVTCVFDVVNAGDLPMAIEGVYVSCGCTSAVHSKDVIAPGEKGYVYVTFYPKDLDGRYLKTIYVYTTTRPRKNYVRIKATVVP